MALRALVLTQLIYAHEPAWNRYPNHPLPRLTVLTAQAAEHGRSAFDVGRVVNHPRKLVLPLRIEGLPMATSLRWRWRTGITGLPGFSRRRSRSSRAQEVCYFPLLSHGLTLTACSARLVSYTRFCACAIIVHTPTSRIFNPGAAPCSYYAAGNTGCLSRKTLFCSCCMVTPCVIIVLKQMFITR